MKDGNHKMSVTRTVLRIAGVLCVAFSLMPTAVSAQTDDIVAPKPPRIALLRNVTLACKYDYPKYCPVPTFGTVAGGDQVTCLKYFKSDISLGCRHAIAAASQP